VCAALSQGFEPEDVHDVFDEVDADKSGEIDFREFKNMINSFNIKSMNNPKIRSLFHYFDADCDGVIGFTDFALTLYPDLPVDSKGELLIAKKLEDVAKGQPPSRHRSLSSMVSSVRSRSTLRSKRSTGSKFSEILRSRSLRSVTSDRNYLRSISMSPSIAELSVMEDTEACGAEDDFSDDEETEEPAPLLLEDVFGLGHFSRTTSNASWRSSPSGRSQNRSVTTSGIEAMVQAMETRFNKKLDEVEKIVTLRLGGQEENIRSGHIPQRISEHSPCSPNFSRFLSPRGSAFFSSPRNSRQSRPSSVMSRFSRASTEVCNAVLPSDSPELSNRRRSSVAQLFTFMVQNIAMFTTQASTKRPSMLGRFSRSSSVASGGSPRTSRGRTSRFSKTSTVVSSVSSRSWK